jgi:hypothetical protein
MRVVTETVPVIDVSEPRAGDELRPSKHRRTPKSEIAYCGRPATQGQLTDDLGEVDCCDCWRAMGGGRR